MNMIDIIIPVYNPDEKLKKLLCSLYRQSVRADRIILVWTVPDGKDIGSTGCGEYISCYGDASAVDTVFIEKKDFDHGGTRAYAASLSDAEYMLFMTQDAVPADDKLISALLKMFDYKNVAAAYARQLPSEDATLTERITRDFNYPDKERVQNSDTLSCYGIKTYFCSDVCAMYKKVCYDEAGGFVRRTIFNEDMIMAASLVKLGYTVMYTPEAKVVHSHHYTYMEQYRRNFDLAVSQREHPEVFNGVPSEGEGVRLVMTIAKKLVKAGKIYKIPDLFIESAFKYMGYRKGKRFDKLTDKTIMKCTMNRLYWINKQDTNKDN